jgi:hypothetical protein
MFQLQVEFLSQGPGWLSGEMLAAAHLKTSRAMDTLEKAGFSTPADGPSSNDPLRKISEESLLRSKPAHVTEASRFSPSFFLTFHLETE